MRLRNSPDPQQVRLLIVDLCLHQLRLSALLFTSNLPEQTVIITIGRSPRLLSFANIPETQQTPRNHYPSDDNCTIITEHFTGRYRRRRRRRAHKNQRTRTPRASTDSTDWSVPAGGEIRQRALHPTTGNGILSIFRCQRRCSLLTDDLCPLLCARNAGPLPFRRWGGVRTRAVEEVTVASVEKQGVCRVVVSSTVTFE